MTEPAAPSDEREPVAVLFGALPLDELAIPSSIRLGERIASHHNGVVVTKQGEFALVAKVTVGQARTVTVSRDGRDLSWRCSCTRRTDLFCKHLTATVFHLRHQIGVGSSSRACVP